MVKDAVTGVSFNEREQFWQTPPLLCLGASCRLKKMAMIPIKVYAVAFYVEEGALLRELQGLGAISQLATNAEVVADALRKGHFRKVLLIELARSVSGRQFLDGLEESLKPRLKGTCARELAQLKAVLLNQSMACGSVFQISVDGGEGVSFSVLCPSSANYTREPVLAIQNALFTRALMDVYLISQPLLPNAKSIWVDSAAKLLTAP